MARKGSHQKNGLDRHTSNSKKASDSVSSMKGRGKASEPKVSLREESESGNQQDDPFTETTNAQHAGDEDKNTQNYRRCLGTERHAMDGSGQSISSGSNSEDLTGNMSPGETTGVAEENGASSGSNVGPKHVKYVFSYLLNGLHINSLMENIEFSDNVVVRNLRGFSVSILEAMSECLQRQKPLLITLTTRIFKVRGHIKTKIEQVYPVVWKWLMHFGNIMLLLSLIWLDCTLRGIDSFLRMGTTSFFSIIWCSILSVIAMAGMSKFLIVLAIAALTAVFGGLTIAILVVSISGSILLWLYGSFWTTVLVIFLGGLAFMSSHERLALLITTTFSVYCAWMYVGWLGLLLALNLSFISSDALIYFLKNTINQQGRPDRTNEHTNGMQEPGFFGGESVHASSSEKGPGLSADRSPGVPSTSGANSELTSDDEVVRLLNCTDHYSVLGLSRYENVDISLLKREYRKKAMLVHPDKNMGNEKAAEAFKKLQNAYEVLLDSLKRKAYDDELRREELLSYFRRFQSASQKKGGHGFFSSGFAHSEADSDDPFGDSRRIACKKCGNFHVWVLTKKLKSRARWCQDCKDFHQAKDGDGWVEQSSQPIFFGLFQKVDAPSAYVCADGRIYNASEWYICQGMRCPANTHKPSFHVNTSVMSKSSTGKGTSSGQRGGRMPTANMEESMTEEEFLQWLQNAVQSGVFENFDGGTSTESPSARSGSGSKSSGSHTGSASSNKRKKKGKKQW